MPKVRAVGRCPGTGFPGADAVGTGFADRYFRSVLALGDCESWCESRAFVVWGLRSLSRRVRSACEPSFGLTGGGGMQHWAVQ